MTKKAKWRYVYSTIKRGRIRVKSRSQHILLHSRNLSHTHVYKRGHETKRKRSNVK
jgi:hypothetical protein